MGTSVLYNDLCNLGFVLFGYISGSVLYARVFASLCGRDILSESGDKNPGTANAFTYGGFWCGLGTLVFDLLKGFLPVYLFTSHGGEAGTFAAAVIVAAPVIGHAFPLFYGFRGGKGIAVSFGALAGLYPQLDGLLTLAFTFILFSTVLKITPHFHRTAVTYVTSLLLLIGSPGGAGAVPGFAVIAGVVLLRLLLSKEKPGRMEVSLLGRPVAFLRDRRRT